MKAPLLILCLLSAEEDLYEALVWHGEQSSVSSGGSPVLCQIVGIILCLHVCLHLEVVIWSRVIDKNNDTLCANSGEVKQSQCRPQLCHENMGVWCQVGSRGPLHLSAIVYIAQPPHPTPPESKNQCRT